MSQKKKKTRRKVGKEVEPVVKRGIRKTFRACPECGSHEFIEDQTRGELICAKCGLVIEEELIDVGQEWRAFDSEQMMRRARGGAPLAFSVDYEEPIVLRINGHVKVVKIGEFVDGLIAREKPEVVGNLEVLDVSDRGFEVLAFDENYKVCFKPVSEVSRHRVDEMFRLKLETGVEVKVTGSHSVFAVEDGEVVAKQVDELKVGDFLVAPFTIPVESVVKEIDLVEEFSKLALPSYTGNVYTHAFGSLSFNYFGGISSSQVDVGLLVPETQSFFGKITNPEVLERFGIRGREKRGKKPPLEKLIPAPSKYRKEWKCRKILRISREFALKLAEKYGDWKLAKLALSDFIFLRVRRIEKVKPTKPYAYDLSVPGYENFGGKIFFHNTKHDKGLTTEIGKGVGELYKVHPEKRAQYYRLTKWHRRFMKAKDRNLSFAFSELQRIVSYLNLPKTIHERIARYYEQCVEKGLVRGRSIEAIIAALTYAVAREMGSPRTPEEIAEASGVDKKEIGRTYRYIARELGIRILPANPEDFVPRFCSLLGLSERVAVEAIKVIKAARKKDIISGKGPTGVAAAAIYIGSVLAGEKRTQREIADLCNITEVTIRCRYRELVKKLGIEEEVERKAAEE